MQAESTQPLPGIVFKCKKTHGGAIGSLVGALGFPTAGQAPFMAPAQAPRAAMAPRAGN